MKTYHGSPCKVCGNTEKYLSNQSCKNCTVQRSKYKLYDGTVDKYHTAENTRERLARWRKNNPEKVKQQRTRRQPAYKKYYQENVPAFRDRHLKRYGLTLETYTLLLNQQNNVCAICKRSCTSGKALAVDHDHTSHVNRGLLCKNCNVGLGMFFDNIEKLASAIEYLRIHKCVSP